MSLRCELQEEFGILFWTPGPAWALDKITCNTRPAWAVPESVHVTEGLNTGVV